MTEAFGIAVSTSDPEAEAFAAFLTEIDSGASADPDAIAAAFARHLAGITTAGLPAGAQPNWDRIVVRLLKSPLGKTPGDRAIDAIRSWPSSRIAELIGEVAAIHEHLQQRANDRMEDEFRTKIAHSYL
jgi:hypothetical protein